jgi:hypothetical protein
MNKAVHAEVTQRKPSRPREEEVFVSLLRTADVLVAGREGGRGWGKGQK